MDNGITGIGRINAVDILHGFALLFEIWAGGFRLVKLIVGAEGIGFSKKN